MATTDGLEGGDDEVSNSSTQTMIGPPTLAGFPRMACLHSSFGQAEITLSNIGRDMDNRVMSLLRTGFERTLLKMIVDGDDGLSHISDVENFYSPLAPVTMLGVPGSGKSSTINSMLGEKLAFERSTGGRGTFVLFEYHSALPDQACSILMRIQYLSEEQRTLKLVKLLHDLSDEPEPSSEGLGEDQIEEEREESAEMAREKRQTAMEALRDMLCDRLPHEPDLAQVQRLVSSEQTHDWILQIINERLGELGVTDNIQNVENHDSVDLELNINSNTRSSIQNGVRQRSLWPLIERVHIHRANQVLDSGIVVVDTPGVFDANLDVRQHALGAIAQAGLIVLVCGNERVEIDARVGELVRLVIQANMIERLVVVFTHIDQMSNLTPSDLAELAVESRNNILSLAEEVRTAETLLESTQGEFEAAQAHLVTSQMADFQASIENFAQRRTAWEESMTACGKLKEEFRVANVDRRCRGLEHEFARVMNQTTASNIYPPQFFISNTTQFGIPSIRRYVVSSSLAAKERELRKASMMTRRCVQQVRSVITTPAVPTARRMHDMIMRAVDASSQTRVIETDFLDMRDRFASTVEVSISRSTVNWEQQALRSIDRWSADHRGPTFHAIVRRAGQWSTRGIDWNADVHAIYANDISLAFQQLRAACSSDVRSLRDKILAHMAIARRAVEDALVAIGSDELGGVLEDWDTVQHLMVDDLDDARQSFSERLSSHHTIAATHLPGFEGDLIKVLRPVYLSCTLVLDPDTLLQGTRQRGIEPAGTRVQKSTVTANKVEILRNAFSDGNAASVWHGLTGRWKTEFTGDVLRCRDQYLAIFATAARRIDDRCLTRFREHDMMQSTSAEQRAQIEHVRAGVLQADLGLADVRRFMRDAKAHQEST